MQVSACLKLSVAVAVATIVLKTAAWWVTDSVGLLSDALESLAEIDSTLNGFRHQVLRFDHLSSRRAGSRRFIDLHMHLPGDWSLGRAAALRSAVEQALMSAVPGLRASIQLLPMDVETHAGGEGDLP